MKRIALFSGGIDSTVVASIAALDSKEIPFYLLSRFYGHRREENSALIQRNYFKPSKFMVFDSPLLLLNPEMKNYDLYLTQNDFAHSYDGQKRRLIMTAGKELIKFLEKDETGEVILGVNKDDLTRTSCTRDNFRELEMQLKSLDPRLRLITPLIDKTKKEVIKIGAKIKAPMYLSWSCYRDANNPCGICEACLLREFSFRKANIQDPLKINL
jgi:7-cyano-7-deazaguanine synthase